MLWFSTDIEQEKQVWWMLIASRDALIIFPFTDLIPIPEFWESADTDPEQTLALFFSV